MLDQDLGLLFHTTARRIEEEALSSIRGGEDVLE
jgi:hypothetical protein